MGSGKEEPADEIVLPGGMSEASGVDTQAQSSGGGSSSSEVSLFQPGILQNMMTEVKIPSFLPSPCTLHVHAHTCTHPAHARMHTHTDTSTN